MAEVDAVKNETENAPTPHPSSAHQRTLDEIALHFNSVPVEGSKDKYEGGDKASSGQSFTSFYSSLLDAKRRQKNLQFLEVGVWYGKSLAMWSEYFEECVVHGIDINLGRFRKHRPDLEKAGAFSRNPVKVFELDTWSDDFLEFVKGSELPPVDVVLDDGNHNADSQFHLFRTLFPKMKPGGVYIVEDLEQPGLVFSGSKFGPLIGAVGNPSYLGSGQMMREKETALEELGRRHEVQREKLKKEVDRLTQLAFDSEKRERFQELLAEKRHQLKEMPESVPPSEVTAVKKEFESRLSFYKLAAPLIESVEIRRMNLIFRLR
uniref:Methyltransferase domain-containing protein n=1 Tax=Chromera velia CCMP2878 TaxID=1169474 RepID=A0A0G4H9Q7_9ALVE|mmetsp:Transcript_55515/g.108703  ORF Transcript_55515/g.108703 Transcript_55515/m.108703 type:complete len:320 (+) Transcript_55515:230-1189(+)|eukprot:Cvel_25450.t1-p1 / transcript=Cvel_25450.t1 / gene=Cvel_25450 / organism=Chromera_velia_CCMP2878 / gene_product=Mycinamicin VI 2''-O-methyltransferase, putative / transcript_product=Mycinamicin VI 2''-O-methyltransferase, putative / location=Cvel_scaffold2885:10549-12641(+) / protein_length=319 / sequence_SO=supercontig / SO=protein_coding / is_pseudo=false